MTPYEGPDRRRADPILEAIHDLKVEMSDRLARIETEAKGVNLRLTNHSERIEDISGRAESLEATREYCKGAIKAVAVGVPAFGSVAWLILEIVKTIKQAKGGG